MNVLAHLTGFFFHSGDGGTQRLSRHIPVPGAPGCFTHRRMSSSRSILMQTLETASSSDEARMSKECLRITGISDRLGLTATCQARPTPSAFILYPRYSVWCSGIGVNR